MKVALMATEDSPPSLANQMKKWMDHVIGPRYRQYKPADKWSPAVNVYEDEHAYHIVADLAGMSAESINLQIDDDTLTLSGDRPPPHPEGKTDVECMHLMEIEHGAFFRSVELPTQVDGERVQATYRFGLLWVCLPKKPH